MPFLNQLLNPIFSKRQKRIEYFMRHAHEVQQAQFNELLKIGENTHFGQEHQFKQIKTLTDYQRQVPLSEYNAFSPYIERIRQGEDHVLWPGQTRWFAKSSGTTSSKSKYIPITKASLNDCHFQGGRDVLITYALNHPKTKIFTGRSLIIGGSQQVNQYANNIYYGDLSAVLIENMPVWSRLFRTPDKTIALMPEWEEKLQRMAEQTSRQKVVSISGVPSWTLVLIKRLFELTGKDDLKAIWPSLEVFIHGGVSFTPYQSEYQKLIRSGGINYMESYNASEGFFALQNEPDRDDMLLMLDYGIFYEFLPMEEWDKDEPQAIGLEDVALNKNYALIITTNGGLWRYMIGDTIQFTSKAPYKIKITGRTRHFINAFGEELIIDNAEQALKAACQESFASIREYTAAPVYMQGNQQGGHQWLIEFLHPPKNIDSFTKALDLALQNLNSDYEAKRYKSKVLDVPKIVIARENLFYDWLKQKGKLGGQHKIPRLANHRQYIEELLMLNKNFSQ